MGMRRQAALLRRRDFGLIWWGGLVSRIGDGFTLIAISWFFAERNAPAELGLWFLCFELAAIAGGILLSGVMDAYSRRWLMVLDSLVRAAAIAVIPAVGLFTDPGLGVLLPAAAVLGFFSPTADVGLRTITVDLVEPSELIEANSLEQVQWITASLVGPALAGVVVAAAGALTALWIDAASFAVFAAALIAMSERADRLHGQGGGRRSFLRDVRGGIAYICREPIMWGIIQLTAGARIANGGMAVALPFLVQDLGGGSVAYGVIGTIGGAAGLVGTVAAGPLYPRVSATLAVTALSVFQGVALLAIALQPPLVVVALVIGLMSFTLAPWNVFLLTLRQRLVPPELLGRVMSLTMLSIRAGEPVGAGLGGAMLGPLGPAAVIGAAGLLALANSAASLASRRWRRLEMRVG
jgi:predicted MFS family arabinose efflux permease